MTFVALLAYGARFRASAVKGCLVAICFFHLAHNYENPLDKLPRVWQAYLAVKRQQGPTSYGAQTSHHPRNVRLA